MRIRLHKSSHERHVLEVQRADGTTSRHELETRSCLRHDLMHWAFERRAGLGDSFYGKVERGIDLAGLRMAAPMPAMAPEPDELLATEILVGMFQGAIKFNAEPAAFVAKAREMLELQGHAVPAFLSPELVRDVLADYRRLVGQWESLRPGGVLELEGSFAK
ncbi:MAG TPA: hypothetical protein VK348_08665 [Planctomycetota bacterium]|nr:hypothetical protein [Planctomycetota bacterium]